MFWHGRVLAVCVCLICSMPSIRACSQRSRKFCAPRTDLQSANEPHRVAIAVGAVAERGRILPCIVFMFVWSTLVYDPIACWNWNPSGWIYKLGGLDFAGGTTVHIAAGTAALAYSFVLGRRTGHNTQTLNYRPHNVTSIVIGTVFLWVGWFG